MEKRNRNVMILSIVAIVLVLVGVTYAYFSAQITGIESASTISMTAGRMSIVYTEGDENVTANNIYPREEEWITKVFTLTGYNTTNEEMYYNVGLNVETNGFANNYLTYDLKVLESDSGTPVSDKTGAPINGTGFIKFGKGTFKGANGDKHKYELKIYFKDNGKNQNDAQGAAFNAKISVVEYKPYKCYTNDTNSIEVYEKIISYDINKENCLSFASGFEWTSEQQETYCTGGEFTDKIGNLRSIASDLNTDFKEALIQNGVIENVVFDKTSELLRIQYRNGQYRYFYDGESNEWKVRLLDNNSTAPVTSEFCTSINDKFITNLSHMFLNSQATSIDLSSFDTSKVTNMYGMFYNSQATSLDLSNFDTSNVTDMSSMFHGSQATSLDLSNFDTSNVTSMQQMFENSQATSLNISSFDTSKVTEMSGMFSGSQATTLDLSHFDTSKVIQMSGMFMNSQATTLDLSSFDTSKVTNMYGMFYNSQATSLDLSHFDTSNVTNMSYMFKDSAATTGYARTQTDANKFNSSSNKPSTLTFVVK